ncbi:hypothetical protein LX32DRAFT_635022 [Colletotrichum zoysiae]|uniref:Uncharacterized protein n=1 Tax=Colletotrichum zoysiae TaxID=1216348 RepID=A0AAD9HTW6_9PEZI|nr:hypothetical protein LX32DRAFT_635022 [Colletotrichum zoysiae]
MRYLYANTKSNGPKNIEGSFEFESQLDPVGGERTFWSSLVLYLSTVPPCLAICVLCAVSKWQHSSAAAT